MRFPKCINLTIKFNPGATSYMTVKEWIEEIEARNDDSDPTWVGEHERATAIFNNEVWVCQWYPRTPVACHIMAASSFERLLKGIQDEEEADR